MLEQLVFDLAERAFLVRLVPPDEPGRLQPAEGTAHGVTADRAAAVRGADSLSPQGREYVSDGERAPGRRQEQAVKEHKRVERIGQTGPEHHVRMNRHRRQRLRATASSRHDLPLYEVSRTGRVRRTVRVVQQEHLPR
ncbi:hypothetical protein [Streptomyces sp. NPDC004589]|uniref:hypothetical protein n=1 Tax=Streptomyces sp. NPDC004589 TaxID=3154553 RepID=UPI0033ACD8FD